MEKELKINNDRWQQIKEILEIALEKDNNSLEKYLNKACNGDENLKLEVISLISLRKSAKNFLETNALDIIDSSLIEDIKAQENKFIVDNNLAIKETKNILGRMLGDFLVKEKLGEGGFGEVYKTTQITLGREAVVKILHTRHSKNQAVIERFKREARLASRLEHPYCAHIYSFGAESDGLLWIAMEMVVGTPLNEILKSQGALSLEKFVPLLDKICEVVHTAHEAGIIHRDLKPANVMVISRAGRLLPKLLDFGIAKNLTQNVTLNSENNEKFLSNIFSKNVDTETFTTETSTIESKEHNDIYLKDTNANQQLITDPEINIDQTKENTFQTHGFIGSPPYMAPEQWENGANVDARSDIYSLGILAYQVINGTLPFTEKMPELYGAHLAKAVPPIKENLPVELNQVLQKALAKRPEERYKTALEFAQAFRQASSFTEEKANLPTLDELLKEDILANAPKPLADTLANLLASHNAYQFRDRLLLMFQTLIRYLGILALASSSNTFKFNQSQQDNELINKLITSLYKESLNEFQWIELIRELSRPFAKKCDAYPIPELVNLFFPIENENFIDLLKLQKKIQASVSLKEENLVKLLADFFAKFTLLLKTTSWLNSYYLVLPLGQQATKWMGKGKDLGIMPIKNNSLANNKAILVDANGNYVISLAPLIEIVEPTPGTALEVFLLEGKGRYGAKLISFPQGFEIENETTWEWFTEHFLEEDEKSQAETLLEKSPYLGLNAFSTTDARLFFGREKQTENLLNRLRIQPLLAVVGPSGAGKSSFIQAGIIASLPKHWISITIRPGPSPLSTLSAKLLSAGIETIDLKNNLQKNGEYLADILRQFARQNNLTILLVVDQFEEIITLCLDKQEQSIYLDAIMSLVRSETEALKVVLTMRDDFLVRAKELNALQNRLNQAIEILTTPDSIQLLKILTLPARRAGYEFEDEELPREIINALTGQTSALPMLSFTASKIWEQRDKQFKQLTRRSYKAMGGVAGALAKYAEEVLEQMTKSEQKLVRETFHHLITSEGTRSILTRSELLQLLGNNKDSEAVLEKLISSRLLLVAEGEKGIDQVEIIHEALLSTWPRLVKWQQEDKEGSRLRDQLRDAARQWQERNRPNGLLWRGEALTELQLWRSRYKANLTDSEQAFANMSFKEATRSQRRRQIVYSAAFAVLSVALITAFWINQQINNQLLNSYLDAGRNELFNDRPLQAIVYLNEVYKEREDNIPIKMLLGEAMKSIEVAQIASFKADPQGVIESYFSLNDSCILTVAKEVKVWDIATGKMLFMIGDDPEGYQDAQFSHNGKLIATASWNGKLKIWDAGSRQLLHTINSSGPLRFSPDDKKIISCRGKNISTWDVTTGEELFTIETPNYSSSIDVSKDGTKVLVSNINSAKLWDLSTGELQLSIDGHIGHVYTSVISPDGSKIATASGDRSAKIWDAKTGKLLISLEGHRGDVAGIDFSFDGKIIATSGFDKTVKIWDATNGRLLGSSAQHIGYIWSVTFNKEATQVVTASYDGTAKILDISKLKVKDVELTRYLGKAFSSEYSKDNKFILTSGIGNEVRLFDNANKKLLKTFLLPDKSYGEFVLAKISPDSKRIAVTSSYDTEVIVDKPPLANDIKIWDIQTGQLLFTLIGHKHNITALAFSPDGKRIATASYDSTVKIWDTVTGQLLLNLTGHKGIVRSVEFSPDASKIITTGEDTTTKLWDSITGQILRVFTIHSMQGVYANFSPDGLRIITTSIDATAKVTDLATGQILFSLDGHSADVRYASFSSDAKLIVTASGDSTAKIWDATTGKLIISLPGHLTWVNTANFSLDQRNLITSSNDGTVRIWELPLETKSPPEIAKIIKQQVPFRFENGQLLPSSK